MTVSLTDLYNRLGGHFGIAKAQIDARAAILTRATNLDGQYTSATRFMYTPVLNQFLSIYGSTDATLSNVQSGARKTLTEMVNADNPSITKETLAAVRELNRQMRASGKYLLKNTVTQGSVTAGGSNVGNGTVLLHGIPSQMSRSETLYFTCISDTTTGAQAGAEVFSMTSSAAYNLFGDARWPGGTGLNTSLKSSDYTATPNLLVNGTFDNWTAGAPDDWTYSGTISQLTSGAYRSPSALKMTSNTAVDSLTQELPNVVLGPGKRLVFGIYAKKISGTVTTDIEVKLQTTSGSSYATLTISAASLTTSWQRFTASFQHDWLAPKESAQYTVTWGEPSSPSVQIALDGAFVFAPAQMGVNGQYVQIVAGSTDWRIGDYLTVTISNDYASNVLNYTERFFAPFANGIELPTSTAGANTIDNSVIP